MHDGPRELTPIVVLAGIALREHPQGARYVGGVAACWVLQCLALSWAARSVGPAAKWSALLLRLELVTVLAAILLALGETWVWPALEPLGSVDLAVECWLAAHLATLVWGGVKLAPDVLRGAATVAKDARLAKSELELGQLRQRLTPHFFRNTLNTVSALLDDDPDEARRVLEILADLLEDAAAPGPEHETVATQVAWLQRYVSILETRYGERITFSWITADAALSRVLPRLLLQPLIENAVEHGALFADTRGSVQVSFTLSTDGALLCAVEDNGPGLASAPRESTGWRTVRRRLELAYPGAHFGVTHEGLGTRASVSLPMGSVRA